MADQSGATHTVMPKKLAQALMEAGMHHFSTGGIGGTISGLMGSNNDYNATGATFQHQDLLPQISEQQGKASETYANQNNLAKMLLQQSLGGGPNPALNQLNQSTAANVANQGALMASQRGASANPALIAKLAAQQGAQTQQQAAGQAATLGAQQQLAAQSGLGSLYGQQANEALQGQQILQGATAAQNSADVTNTLGAQGINAQVAGQNAATNAGIGGGLLQGAGAGIAHFLNKGGVVKKYADGGITPFATPGAFAPPQLYSMGAGGDAYNKGIGGGVGTIQKAPGPQSTPTIGSAAPDLAPPMESSPGLDAGMHSYGSDMGEAAPLGSAMFAKGGQIPFSQALLSGGKVPGKAQVKGDSKKNDVEPTLLSAGEAVIPRSIMMSEDAPEKAKEFIAHLMKKKSKGAGYGDVIKARCGGGRV